MQTHFQTAIIGAGFAGIIAALRLRKSGRNSFVILERAQDVGGTWRDNTYPGCACDVPSNLYAIAVEPNPDWSRLFSSQPEIWEYLKGVVRKNSLHEHLRLGFDVLRMEFSEQHGHWLLSDRTGRQVTARMVIGAMGPFSRPKLPDIPGIESFQGKTMHSAQWDSGFDLGGKRVAVIGTGASSIQLVPQVAPIVSQLTVFQRSAAWIGDRLDTGTWPLTKKINRAFPAVQRLKRAFWYNFLEWRGRMMLGVDWQHRLFKNLSISKLKREVPDPELRRKLTPNYKMGCKRILVSDDYLPTFSRPNVALETEGIERITPEGILTKDGRQLPFDVLVFATGFEVAEVNTDAKLIGKGGRDLFEQWKTTGLQAYKGTFMSGYPNFAYLLGPNTGLGHNSVLLMMEAQMELVMQYLALLEGQEAKAWLDLKPSVQHSHNEALQGQFVGTVWTSGCQSWYLNGRGKNTTLYPKLVGQFRRETSRLEVEDYVVEKQL